LFIRDLNVASSTVATIMKNADTFKKKMETAVTLRYSGGPVVGKMEQLL
jgi:hypothetical protein